MDSASELVTLLQRWRDDVPTFNYDPLPTLIKICELFEAESKKNPENNEDIYNHRNACELDDTSVLGRMYTFLFKNFVFIKKLVDNFLNDQLWPRQVTDNHNLNIVVCRLLINFAPILNTSLFISSYQLLQRIITWTESTNEQLQTYATGILASCMESNLIVANFHGENNKLIPMMLDRLHLYYTQFCAENEINQKSTQPYQSANTDQPNGDFDAPSSKRKAIEKNGICGNINSPHPESNLNNWKQIYPLTLLTKLDYCLKYLAITGKCKDFLSHAYEKNALNLLMKIIDSSEKQNECLTLEALKYLGALLCHKTIAAEFIGSQGLQKLLLIPKPSILCTGVSICFYNLSNCNEVMESVCLLPKHVLVDLVKYAFWMLGCSNNFSKCNATMFFNNSIHFRVIHEIFDNHDGLSKLFNMVSSLPVFSSEHPAPISLYGISAKKVIQNFCDALICYFKEHLNIKAHQLRKAKMEDSGLLISSRRVHNEFTSLAEVQDELELLSNDVYLKNHWTPIDQLLKVDGLRLLLQIISVSLTRDWKCPFKTRAAISALEVLSICAVLPKFQLALCNISIPTVLIDNQNYENDVSSEEEDDPQTNNDSDGLKIILKAARKPLVDIQKAALSVIVNCVCAPQTYDDAVTEQFLDCFRNNNGIMVLLTTIKSPISDVAVMRGLASRALAGLARNESVRQIFRKLSLFNSGLLQSLIKNLVLQEQRPEHVTFQKYATELIELVLGIKNWSVGRGISPISYRHTIQNQESELANSSNGQNLTLLTDNNNSHKCPNPKPTSSMCTNFAIRFSKNIHSRKLNQRLIHSRFCLKKNILMNNANDYIKCSEFLSQNRVAVGTDMGEIKIFNLFASQQDPSFIAYNDSSIKHLQCSNDKRLLISSSNLTSIWSICNDTINIKYSLDHQKYGTFSNFDQNKILGTNAAIATIYDVETSKRILTLVPRYSNQYIRNRAVFDGTNKLVLSDGVLWDAIARKEIHKFDKLNTFLNGIFHPNGFEIISNDEVWDMRTFQLLRTVPSLEQCNVIFSKSGEGMYLYFNYNKGNVNSYRTSFKTLDPNDYSNIDTVDVKKFIYHMACKSDDTQIAIVENQRSTCESTVEIYDVGISRNKDEAEE